MKLGDLATTETLNLTLNPISRGVDTDTSGIVNTLKLGDDEAVKNSGLKFAFENRKLLAETHKALKGIGKAFPLFIP
ncbi:hypothetical protein [Geomicrobium sp. JCM 19038]|uniref:hypothetical protein n=1 Tax=Geomicrobium sp. JCM 19038 TaxID=1460635 RepID=UPI001268AC22|nr:hypothetical protein [Geomicrobium sp. JCM 19038]